MYRENVFKERVAQVKVLALDVGEKRIGVARADSGTRIAVPVGFVAVDGSEWQEIAKIARLNNTNFFVLGLPRSNEGNQTAQTLYVRRFAKTLTEKMPGIRIRFQDESLTSVVAEERLKSRKKRYEKGEIDAEAAAIILQDFMENFTVADANARTAETLPRGSIPSNNVSPVAKLATKAKATAVEARNNASNIAKREADKAKLNTRKAKHKMKKATKWITIITPLVLILVLVGGFVWAKAQLNAVNPSLCPADCNCECEAIEFAVNEGDSKSAVASNLENRGLIRNAFIFEMYLKMFKPDANFKSGVYLFNQSMDADAIIAKLEEGSDYATTFNFTILPGETIYDIKSKLIGLGYSATEVDTALNADYNFDFLRERPANATLEGYLFGETHEFYIGTSVKEIIETFLKGTEKVISENNLESRFATNGLSLYEGTTLASIVQKEAPTPEMPTVAQVFLSRLAYGIPLGSDVTVSYALDTIDPDRQTYADNQAALGVDSCYNTRLYGGLPCGPISNPSLSALEAVAEPTDTSYLYFLTGDDGMMYYSYTEDEHIQNIYAHCQTLCDISL